MKKVRCPKCNKYILFDETRYQPGQRLVFVCDECRKQFGVKLPSDDNTNTEKHKFYSSDEDESSAPQKEDGFHVGTIIVVENVFHHRQEIPLEMGDNVLGRFVRGTNINKPIETVDPSVDTRHCIIRVQRSSDGSLQYILRDAPSGTGTFHMNEILRNQDRIRLHDGSIITIGATTLILKTEDSAIKDTL